MPMNVRHSKEEEEEARSGRDWVLLTNTKNSMQRSPEKDLIKRAKQEKGCEQ